MPQEFLDVAVASGCCTQVTKKMTAAFCCTMYDDVHIGVKAQRALNKYLTHHFHKGVCASEHEIMELNSSYIPFQTELLMVPIKGKAIHLEGP